MNSKFLIVVVVYEVALHNSITLQRLQHFQQIWSDFPYLLIYDNSKKAKDNSSHFLKLSHYHHNPNNDGVGGAYNYAIALGEALQKEWLILLDQDTYLSDDYFEQLKKSMMQFPKAKLFCPFVRSNNVIVSPTYFIAEKPISFKKHRSGMVKSKYYTVINSSLVVQLMELKMLGGFDKLLPLDYSDHYFFHKFKSRNKYFVIVHTENQHSLSSHADVHFDVVYRRYLMHYRSTIIYSNKINSYLPIFWLALRTLRLTFRFSRLDFLKFFWSGRALPVQHS